MSRIADALKRASRADRSRARQAATEASLEPVAAGRDWSLSLALGAGAVVTLAMAGWLFRLWWEAGRQSEPANVVAVAAVAPKPAPAPVTAVAAARAVPQPVPAPAPAPPAKAVEAPWPAQLKLMGIFFSKTNPRALINGKTVAPGEEVGGIRVTRIEADRVRVEWNGRVKEMILKVN